jgi:menaquinone-9 beta-reductase
MGQVHIIGGGPAGAAAALAALDAGASVRIYEKSSFPRHKVCGEFLSPAAWNLFAELGVAAEFESALPSPICRAHLHFGRTEKRFRLPETAWGLSRAALDHLLLRSALDRGAELQRERMTAAPTPLVLAYGRHSVSEPSEKGRRLFGFKAHFSGPLTDAVELYFFDGCYVGVNPAGSGITNVCGIAPENLMRRYNFDHDELVASSQPLGERLAPLKRSMEWLSVGPLRFGNKFHTEVAE